MGTKVPENIVFRCRFGFSVVTTVLFVSQPGPLRADEAFYLKCVRERTAVIAFNIVKQCRADRDRIASRARLTDALVKEEQLCESTASANAKQKAEAECRPLAPVEGPKFQ